MGVSESPTAEQLLADAAWLRRLAITLAGNEADAEDLVQQSWIAAWRKKPDSDRPLRPWLSKVVRDLAGMRRRADRRREAREQVIIHDEVHAAQPDELLDQMRIHRLLVDLVLDLAEPYRATIIARFVEGRTAAAIARSQQIPESTVRGRLRDGLALLRSRLDAARGDRKKWAPAVLAFAKGGVQVARPTKLLLVVPVAILVAGAIAVIVVAIRHPSHNAMSTATTTASDPRGALHRRFPASSRAVSPAALPPGAFAINASPTTIASAMPPTAGSQTVEFYFRLAPFVDLMRVFRKQLDVPIWVAYETDATIDIDTHGKRPIFEVLDEVLDRAGANRAEVAAIRIVPGGQTDASVFGGEPVTLSVRNTPINDVLDAIEPRLGMPIGRVGSEVIPGTVDANGNPLVDESPRVTLELHDVPAGAALEQALIQAHVGYELTTGFVILPR